MIDGQRIGRDIYIHQADTILGVSMEMAVSALFGALIAVLLWFYGGPGDHQPEAKGSWFQ